MLSQKDYIKTNLLRKNTDFFAKYTRDDFNASICSSKFPNEVKHPDIVPAYKKNWKRDFIKMRKHVEMFNSNKDYKFAIVVFMPILLFSKQKFVVYFSNVICLKMRPRTHLFFIWNESLQYCLSYDLEKMSTF